MVAARCFETLAHIRCYPQLVHIEYTHSLESTNCKWAISITIPLDCVRGPGGSVPISYLRILLPQMLVRRISDTTHIRGRTPQFFDSVHKECEISTQS